MPSQQSAYRQHHSTETAVLKVYNDLLMAADSGLVFALCLLDLTAAFDTALVQVLPERQILSCLVCRRHLKDCARHLLGSPGFSPRPATVYHVLCGLGQQGCRA